METHFLNLTNGLAWVNLVPRVDGYVRIQSTACEQKRWGPILEDLDYNFLFALAKGRKVVVYDSGSKGETRALWQGIPWIEFALNKIWLDCTRPVMVKGHNVTEYFEAEFSRLSDQHLKKIKYMSKFSTITEPIKIKGLSQKTNLDGKYELWGRMG